MALEPHPKRSKYTAQSGFAHPIKRVVRRTSKNLEVSSQSRKTSATTERSPMPAGTHPADSVPSGEHPLPRTPRPHTQKQQHQPPALKIGFIPGVEPDTFAVRWASDRTRPAIELVPISHSEQVTALAGGRVDLVFARLPWAPDADHAHSMAPSRMHILRLWEEAAVAVISSDNELSLFPELTAQELADSPEFSAQESGDERARIEIVATGVGHTIMPMSLARLHHRKDVTYRKLADVPGTQIALVWPKETDDDLRQEFVAVVRGRTARSSRAAASTKR